MEETVQICSQRGCVEPATHSYCWPGQPGRLYACDRHYKGARAVSNAMGFPLSDVQPAPGEETVIRATSDE